MSYYLPTSKQQRAINHILNELKDHDRLYTEDGDHNEQGQSDMAVGNLISPAYDSVSNNPSPSLWTKPELKAIYKLAYRLSKDNENHAIEESYTEDKLTMLESANTVFNLHDHREPATVKELYDDGWLTLWQYIKYRFLKRGMIRQNDIK